MATKIFVNLPVKDLKKSIEFFTKIGYEFNLGGLLHGTQRCKTLKPIPISNLENLDPGLRSCERIPAGIFPSLKRRGGRDIK